MADGVVHLCFPDSLDKFMISKKGVSVKIIAKDRVPAMNKAVAELLSRQVLVGVPSEKAGRKQKKGKINNAALAYIHNMGSPSQNIPQREFMQSGVAQVRDRVEQHMGNAGRYGMQGNVAAMERELHAVGAIARDGMRRKLHEGPFEPLKPGTLAARRRRGRTGERPLEDTGQLRNALDYVLENSKRRKV